MINLDYEELAASYAALIMTKCVRTVTSGR